MLTNDYRITRMQKTLRWLEEDSALLTARFHGLSRERHDSAKRFATAIIDQARAELHRLLQQQPEEPAFNEPPCEPAD